MDNLKTQFLGFINTPLLFTKLYGLTQFELNIDEIDTFDFTKLDIPNNLNLGRRIEYFFKFYIEHSCDYELIKSNTQIIDKKETLGELDFLIYDKRKEKYLHIEHIYKYYLYDISFSNEIDRFIGPNRNDTLVKKLEKLEDKQLPLLFNEKAKKYLDDINLDTIEQKVCFKGNIYLPLELQNKDIPIVNNSCVQGFYVNYNEFLAQKHFKEYLYFLPHRNDWVCDSNINTTWLSFDKVREKINLYIKLKKSPLVWLYDKEKHKTQSFFTTYY